MFTYIPNTWGNYSRNLEQLKKIPIIGSSLNEPLPHGKY